MQDNRYYGEFGGQYVSESLMNTLNELEKAFDEAIKDPQFIKEYMYYLKEYVGRETPLYYAERISEKYGAQKDSKPEKVDTRDSKESSSSEERIRNRQRVRRESNKQTQVRAEKNPNKESKSSKDIDKKTEK